MKAQEARQKAIEVNVSENSEQYVKIKAAVNEQAGKGKYQAYVDFLVNEALKKKLESDGFKVHSGSDRGESFTTISW